MRRGWIIATGICWLAALAGGVGSASLLQRDLPQVLSLEDYAPPVLTRVYARDGSLLNQFGQERRIVVPLSQIPESFRQALLSIEDADFYHHPGVDPSAIVRAVWRDVISGRRAQGASTITQQLARDLRLPTVFGSGVLTTDKTITRKIQEWILAFQIEKTYTKDEILELYCNQIYFGHGFYGVEAASRFYFGKPAATLSLDEAALLAGVVQRPEAYSPIRHPERARGRRNIVLRRMAAEGYLTAAQAEVASNRPVAAVRSAAGQRQIGRYFLEEIRKDLAGRYGETAIYEEGMEVRTTLDPTIQRLAENTLRKHLRAIDRRRGFRPIVSNVLEDPGVDPDEWTGLDGDPPPQTDHATRGVVLAVTPGEATVRLPGNLTGRLLLEGAAWTKTADLTDLLETGDVTLFDVEGEVEGTAPVSLRLDQEPAVEGAVVVLAPRSGAILALVGGYDFGRSQFDRAIQARRPVGSSFKPILYAAALEQGLTPADLIFDEPSVFVDPRTGDLYQPENYERDYWGLITLRTALEHSRNIAAVKLINHIGFKPVFDVAARLGLTARLRPFPSLALGAVEVSLVEMTSAYGAFAGGGIHVDPHMLERVVTRNGITRFQANPASREAMDPAVAYVLTHMLQGVIRRGSGSSVADFPRPVAGKTGTTDRHSDAWFIGYTPDLVCGVWVGLDRVESIGRGQSGARVALPIWNEIMRAATEGRPVKDFDRPSRVVQAPIDIDTGLRASVDTGCKQILLESFVEGTVPQQRCGPVPHTRHALPYFLQREPLEDDLRLHLTRDELDGLLDRESAFLHLLPLSSSLAVAYGDTASTVGIVREGGWRDRLFAWGRQAARSAAVPHGPLLQEEPSPDVTTLPEPPEGTVPLAERLGLDGRRPAVFIVHSDR